VEEPKRRTQRERRRAEPATREESGEGAWGRPPRDRAQGLAASAPAGPLFADEGRFRPLSQLGRGGMGVVWEVYDRERDLRLALKQLQHFSPERLLRFKTEFRALRDLRHPNLVVLDELLESDGAWYFTMEVVEGLDFSTYVRGEKPHHGRGSAAFATTPHQPVQSTVLESATFETVTLRDGAGAPPHAPQSPPAPEPPSFDEGRLRAALRQLAVGIAALHRAGKIHRDLKPSNILVEPGGRVVILDFGVVAEADRPADGRGVVVGTYAYMAPEQASGEPATPAADWYAFGVLLYEALTGLLPFRGSSDQIVTQKLCRDPPPPGVHTFDLPEDLSSLCMALLARDPAGRPAEAAVLAALGVDGGEAEATGGDRLGVERAPFVGRRRELELLTRAFERSQTGAPATVLIEGQSGVGKTATVDAFLSHLDARRRGGRPLSILRGRCHERENVPYKALDGVIDDLTRALASGSTAPPQVTPEDAACLVRLFPALGAGLPAVDASSVARRDDELDNRAQAFTALATVFAHVARHAALVVAIDDLQWADADSLLLLHELTGDGAPPWLLLLTAREGEETQRAVRHVRGAVERVSLQGLPREEARSLVAELLATVPGSSAHLDVDGAIEESSGHPMFLDELVRHLGARGDASGLTLDEALRARVGRLGEAARRIVQAVAVAGSPVPNIAIARAADIEPELYRAEVDRLRAARLVRSRGSRWPDTLEPYHDRVREALYEALGPHERKHQHLRLARALEEAGGVLPDLLAYHFERGGDRQRAARYALKAAEAAARMFAFDQAAELYRTALALGEHAPERAAALHETLGEMLQNAGRARQAADAYAAAAAVTAENHKLDLQRRSAEQLLMGGHVREGKLAADRVLASIGMRLPTSSLRVLASLFFALTRIQLSRLRWQPRAEAEAVPDEISRVDMCWSVGAGLSMIDTVTGMRFASIGLLPSLRLGEPFRIARASCTVSVVCSALELERLSERTLALSRAAADAHGTTLAHVYAEVSRVVHLFLVRQQWAEAEVVSRKVLAMWKDAGMGRGFEFDFVTQFRTWCLALRGCIEQERREVEPLVRGAARAGNRFLEVSLRVFHHLPFMAADEPEEGQRDIADAIGSWLDVDAFSLPHCWTVLSQRSLRLYAGRLVEEPAERADWRRLRHSVLWQIKYLRDQGEYLEARWRIARALEAERHHQWSAVRAERRRAWRMVRRLRRRRGPVTRLWGELVRAGLYASKGRTERAVTTLEPLVNAFEQTSSHLHAACARWRLGETVGGDRGAALIDAAQRWFRGEGVRRPERLVAMMAPGWR
jgi:eukaryotic-like serine/threonine-protein kinase